MAAYTLNVAAVQSTSNGRRVVNKKLTGVVEDQVDVIDYGAAAIITIINRNITTELVWVTLGPDSSNTPAVVADGVTNDEFPIYPGQGLEVRYVPGYIRLRAEAVVAGGLPYSVVFE